MIRLSVFVLLIGILACICSDSPAAAAPPEAIIEFCKQHIAHFKAPAAVEFGDLPKTSTGKIQKFVLRDREWGGRTKRIN